MRILNSAIAAILLSGCFYSNNSDPFVEIPIALYFPNEDTKADEEEKYAILIEELNDRINFISFYLDSVDVAEYNLVYTHGITDQTQYTNEDALPIFTFLSIEDENGYFDGYAEHSSFCERFVVMSTYAIEDNLNRILTHEMGHIFGLSHVSDSDNFMFGEALTNNSHNQITDQQHKKMHHNSLGYRMCF